MIDCSGAFLFACSSLCGPDTAVGVFRWVIEWYGQSLDRAYVGLWGWESWSLRRLASRWCVAVGLGAGRRDGEGASNPCLETLSLLSFAERSYEAFALATSPAYRSDYPCHRHGSYDVNNTNVTQSTQMHSAIYASPCFCCTTSHHRDYAGNMAETLPSSMMGKMRAFLWNRIMLVVT